MAGITVTARQRAYVRGRAQAHMTSEIVITRFNGDGELDKDTFLLTPGDSGEVYNGKARIWDSQGSGALMIGDDADLAMASVNISIPWDSVTPHRDDVVTITDTEDPDWVGRTLRVTDVDGNGISSVAQRMSCTAIVPNRSWDDT